MAEPGIKPRSPGQLRNKNGMEFPGMEGAFQELLILGLHRPVLLLLFLLLLLLLFIDLRERNVDLFFSLLTHSLIF